METTLGIFKGLLGPLTHDSTAYSDGTAGFDPPFEARNAFFKIYTGIGPGESNDTLLVKSPVLGSNPEAQSVCYINICIRHHFGFFWERLGLKEDCYNTRRTESCILDYSLAIPQKDILVEVIPHGVILRCVMPYRDGLPNLLST